MFQTEIENTYMQILNDIQHSFLNSIDKQSKSILKVLHIIITELGYIITEH
jgi:hypothetical protein